MTAEPKGSNSRKRVAPESEESQSDEPSQRRPHKRVKQAPEVEEIADEEIEEIMEEEEEADIEEVSEDSDDDGIRDKVRPTQGNSNEDGVNIYSNAKNLNDLLFWLQGDLTEQHCGEIPGALMMKKDSTKDLLTIFSDIAVVKFTKGGKTVSLRGRWCLPCK